MKCSSFFLGGGVSFMYTIASLDHSEISELKKTLRLRKDMPLKT